MSKRKTAISLDEKLFREVEKTARDLKTSRSGVISAASSCDGRRKQLTEERTHRTLGRNSFHFAISSS